MFLSPFGTVSQSLSATFQGGTSGDLFFFYYIDNVETMLPCEKGGEYHGIWINYILQRVLLLLLFGVLVRSWGRQQESSDP